MFGRAKATALLYIWPTASMICIGDAHRIPNGQQYVMLHAVRGEADVAAVTLPKYVDVS